MFGRGTGKPRGQLGGLSISRCGLGSIVGRVLSILVAVGRVLVAMGRVVGRGIFSLALALLRVECCLY